MKKERLKFLVLMTLLGMALLFTSAPALAQEIAAVFDIGWWTVDNGGGSSSGSVYSIDGTLGQPDAGVLTGGSYSISGGFWGAASPDAPPVAWGGYIYLPLSLRGFCGSSPVELEPNNLIDDANRLCPGRSVSGSHDGAAGTGDLFRMETDKPFQLTLTTARLDGVQLLLYVWQDDALELIEQDATDPFLISHTPTQTQRFYVYVYSDAGVANTASYTLNTSSGTLQQTAEEQNDAVVLPDPPALPIREVTP